MRHTSTKEGADSSYGFDNPYITRLQSHDAYAAPKNHPGYCHNSCKHVGLTGYPPILQTARILPCD